MFKTIEEEIRIYIATAEDYQNRAIQAFAKGDLEKAHQLMDIACEGKRIADMLTRWVSQ